MCHTRRWLLTLAWEGRATAPPPLPVPGHPPPPPPPRTVRAHCTGAVYSTINMHPTFTQDKKKAVLIDWLIMYTAKRGAIPFQSQSRWCPVRSWPWWRGGRAGWALNTGPVGPVSTQLPPTIIYVLYGIYYLDHVGNLRNPKPRKDIMLTITQPKEYWCTYQSIKPLPYLDKNSDASVKCLSIKPILGQEYCYTYQSIKPVLGYKKHTK